MAPISLCEEGSTEMIYMPVEVRTREGYFYRKFPFDEQTIPKSIEIRASSLKFTALVDTYSSDPMDEVNPEMLHVHLPPEDEASFLEVARADSRWQTILPNATPVLEELLKRITGTK